MYPWRRGNEDNQQKGRCNVQTSSRPRLAKWERLLSERGPGNEVGKIMGIMGIMNRANEVIVGQMQQ